jgi:hypothetical protein
VQQQLVLQPLLGESPDINAFLARRKTYLPFTSSATPGEAALAKEMADLAQLLKARSAKPADIRRAIDAAAADHPIDTFKRNILAFITRVKHCSPRPFLYQVYDDIATGRYVPSAKSKPYVRAVCVACVACVACVVCVVSCVELFVACMWAGSRRRS